MYILCFFSVFSLYPYPLPKKHKSLILLVCVFLGGVQGMSGMSYFPCARVFITHFYFRYIYWRRTPDIPCTPYPIKISINWPNLITTPCYNYSAATQN